MDPVAEQLHLERRERLTFAQVDRAFLVAAFRAVAFLVAALALAAATGPVSFQPVALAASVVAVAALLQAEYEVGPVSTSPVQLAFVTMWFTISPGGLPLAAASAHLLGVLVGSARTRRSLARSLRACVYTVGDAWYAFGPALVLTAVPVSGAREAGALLVTFAIVAQFAFDAANLQSQVAMGASRPVPVSQILWLWCIDAGLAPLGFAAALALADTPLAPLLVLPLAPILATFAKERDHRIAQALELSSAYRGTAQLMGDVLEADDAYTGGEHTQGVVGMALELGRAAGLDAQQMRDLEFGALLHDIGKLRVPNEIINKPGKLTDEEWDIIKLHPAYGQEMLDRVGGELSRVGVIVRAHHERWDGAGYPDRLTATEIPIEARIITICDSFSAMTTDRSYRKGMSIGQALVELDRCSGTQFDPELVAHAKAVLGSEQDLRVVAAPLAPSSFSAAQAA